MEEEKHGEIILYHPDETVKLEVRLEDETVWLTQAQMAELFQTTPQNITIHIKGIYTEEELDSISTCKECLQVQTEGKRRVRRRQKLYNLDVIISVGYRVKSKRGTQFRQWANKVLKEYLLRGYSLNYRFDRLEKRVSAVEDKVDFFVRTSLPPVEGIFYNGQIFDTYAFCTNLIRSAKHSLILIDNYIDESVLLMLSKRGKDVSAVIYTNKVDARLDFDLKKFNTQYSPIEMRLSHKIHDRFLLIDGQTVYHIGASLKDLGKKMFAFSKLNVPIGWIIEEI